MADHMRLKIGDNIMGESTDQGYENWIIVHSWSWGASQSGTTHEGMGGGGGKVSVQNLVFSKYVDSSTHDLIKHVCSGQHIDTAELVVFKAGGGAPVAYWRIKLNNLMIVNYQTAGSQDGLDRVTETIEINFEEFQLTYTKQEADGSPGPESTAGWNIKNNVEV